MSIKKRLDILEGDIRATPEDIREQDREREKERADALHVAECSNRDSRREGLGPFFKTTESGEVFSAYDGRPVTRGHQALAERLYWRYLAWGVRGHDEEAEALYTPEGELALSRTRFNLAQTFRLASK